LARTHSSRATTALRSTTPGSSVPRAAPRAGTISLIAAAYTGSATASSDGLRVPWALRTRSTAMRSATRQSMRPRRAERSMRRPITVAAAPARLRSGSRPAENASRRQPDRPAELRRDGAGSRGLSGGISRRLDPARPCGSEIDRFYLRELLTEHPLRDRPESSHVAAGQLRCVAVASVSCGGSWPAMPARAAVPRVVPGASSR